MIYGLGYVITQTNKILATCPAGITFNSNAISTIAKCSHNSPVKQVAGSKISSEEYSVTLAWEQLNWEALQLAYGLNAASATGETYTYQETVKIPTNGIVTIQSSTATPKAILSDGTILKFNVDFSAAGPTSFEFIPILAEKIVTLCYDLVVPPSATGLLETSSLLNDIKLAAVLFTSANPNGVVLVAENCSRISNPTLTWQGDKSVARVTYRLCAKNGSRKPFQLYNLPSTAAPEVINGLQTQLFEFLETQGFDIIEP